MVVHVCGDQYESKQDVLLHVFIYKFKLYGHIAHAMMILIMVTILMMSMKRGGNVGQQR